MFDCEICKKNGEGDYVCERCEKNICSECCSENYPYRIVLCKKCEKEWSKLMEKHNFPK